jgi:oligosaccharyltransferase complex subunit beta
LLLSSLARGFQLTFKGPREEQAPLEEFGEKRFDHLIMFSPSAKCESLREKHGVGIRTDKYSGCSIAFSPGLQPRSVVSSMNEHGINTLFVLSSDISELQRDFAREFDIEFEERDTALIDHFNYVQGSNDAHTHVLLAPEVSLAAGVPSTVISTKTQQSTSPILYSGVAHSVGHNPLLIPVLHAQDTGYSGEPTVNEDEDSVADTKGRLKPVLAGKHAGLVSAMQTRGNARVGWIGSEAMLRDSAWAASVVDSNSNA